MIRPRERFVRALRDRDISEVDARRTVFPWLPRKTIDRTIWSTCRNFPFAKDLRCVYNPHNRFDRFPGHGRNLFTVNSWYNSDRILQECDLFMVAGTAYDIPGGRGWDPDVYPEFTVNGDVIRCRAFPVDLVNLTLYQDETTVKRFSNLAHVVYNLTGVALRGKRDFIEQLLIALYQIYYNSASVVFVVPLRHDLRGYSVPRFSVCFADDGVYYDGVSGAPIYFDKAVLNLKFKHVAYI